MAMTMIAAVAFAPLALATSPGETLRETSCGDANLGPACDAGNGNPSIGTTITPCETTSPPQSGGLAGLVAWHAVHTVDDRRYDRPDVALAPSILPPAAAEAEQAAWGTTPESVEIPVPAFGPRICESHWDDLDEL